MPSEERKVQLVNGKVLIMRPVEDDPPSIYVNNAVFEMTQWDIAIDLSELRGAKPGETPDIAVALINQKVRLIMTVPYAKVFSEALITHLAKYEQIEKNQPPEGELPPSQNTEPTEAN
jgi:hypothetical protein